MCRRFYEKKVTWIIVIFIIFFGIYWAFPGIREPRTISMVGFGFTGACILVCFYNKGQPLQSVPSPNKDEDIESGLPKYDDVVTQEQHFGSGQNGVPLASKLNMADLERPPSYDTALNLGSCVV